MTREIWLGEAKQVARSKRGPAPKWEQQIEAISKLRRVRQHFVNEMLDTVLAQHGATTRQSPLVNFLS